MVGDLEAIFHGCQQSSSGHAPISSIASDSVCDANHLSTAEVVNTAAAGELHGDASVCRPPPKHFRSQNIGMLGSLP